MKEKVKALMETADQAYPMIFTEEHFTNFLSRMTTLHMSPNNAVLLYSQDNNVSYVAGFGQWQDYYARNVRRGQQSLKILAPSKYTFTKENPRIQPDTGQPVMDSNGNPIIDKHSVTVPTFKPVSVFDIAQTYGKELFIKDSFHEGDTDWYFYMQALDNASSYTVDTLPDYPALENEPAFTDQNRKLILVRTDIPAEEIYAAIIKQMTRVKYFENDANIQKDSLTSELEIASIAYAVNMHFELPTEFAFDIEPWAAVQELDTLKQSLKDIKQTANDLITDIDHSLTKLYQNQNKDFTMEAMDILTPDEKIDEAGSKVHLGKLIKMAEAIGTNKPEDMARMNTVKSYLSNLQDRIPEGELKTAVREASWSSTPVVLQNKLERIYHDHLEYKGLLPDTTITQDDSRKYGYTYTDMLPLHRERALELHDSGHGIFLLYDNDSESIASYREAIEDFGGIFGIEREEWDASNELKQLKDDLQNSDSTKEMLLLYGKDNRFGIYQVKRDLTRDYAFESLERLQSRGLFVDRNHYDLVYLNDLPPSATLEDIYEQFNINHPDDYTGRSLSVSDIVVIRKDGETKAHYVNDFGFQEIPDFLEEEHSIRNEVQESAFQGTDYYLSIQETEDGYDYSIFDHQYRLKDGGLLNNPHIPMLDAVKEVVALHGLDDTNLESIDYNELTEAAEQISSAIFEKQSFKPLLQEHLNTNEEAGYLTPDEKRILEDRLSFMDDHMMVFEESYPDGLPLDVETDEIDRLFQEVLSNAKAQDLAAQGLQNNSAEEIEDRGFLENQEGKLFHNLGDILTNENMDFLSLPATGQPQFKDNLSTSDKTQILLDSAKHWKTRLGEQEKQLILDYASHAKDFDHVILLGEELSDSAFEHTFGVMNPVILEELQFEINCLRENNEIYQMAVNIDNFINYTNPDGYKDAFDNKRQIILSLYQIIVESMPEIKKHDLDKALLNLTTTNMPDDDYVKNGNELLSHLEKLENENMPHELAKDILEYTIHITPGAEAKTEKQHEEEISKLANAFIRQQPDMLIPAEMLLDSAADNEPDGTKAAALLQRFTDMNDKIMKKHMEPQVLIFQSDHPAFQKGQQLSLSSANKLMEILNRNDIAKQIGADESSISSCNVWYEIAYLMDGKLYHYTGNQDIVKGHGSIIDHIQTYAEQDLKFSPPIAGDNSRNEEIETLLFCRDELVPYLQMHCDYADTKKSANAALSEARQLPDDAPYKNEKKEYYTALVHHAEKCHEILSLKDMDSPLPEMPRQEVFFTPESPQMIAHDTNFPDAPIKEQADGRIKSRQKQSILEQLASSKQELSNARPSKNMEKGSQKTKRAALEQ